MYVKGQLTYVKGQTTYVNCVCACAMLVAAQEDTCSAVSNVEGTMTSIVSGRFISV